MTPLAEIIKMIVIRKFVAPTEIIETLRWESCSTVRVRFGSKYTVFLIKTKF